MQTHEHIPFIALTLHVEDVSRRGPRDDHALLDVRFHRTHDVGLSHHRRRQSNAGGGDHAPGARMRITARASHVFGIVGPSRSFVAL